MTDDELLAKVESYSYYHIINVTDTISTPGKPAHVPAQKVFMKYLDAINLEEKRVLDVGCRDGLFSFAAEQRGAAEVIGIDNDLSRAAVEFLIPHFRSRVQMVEKNVYDLSPEEMGVFDVILFPGVLYHLRYPFWSIKVLRELLKPGGDLLIDTMIWDGKNRDAMLYCPIDTQHDATTCTLFNRKGLVDTLWSLGFELRSLEYADMDEGKGLARKTKNLIKQALKHVPLVESKAVARGTFHFSYTKSSLDDSFVSKYWEQTHNFHSKI